MPFLPLTAKTRVVFVVLSPYCTSNSKLKILYSQFHDLSCCIYPKEIMVSLNIHDHHHVINIKITQNITLIIYKGPNTYLCGGVVFAWGKVLKKTLQYPHFCTSKPYTKTPSLAKMPRRGCKRKAARGPTTRATKNESKPVPKCSEDWDLRPSQNIEDALDSLDNESGQDSDDSFDDEPGKLPTIPQHSTEIFHCSNVAAHQDGQHYVCRTCATLANKFIRETPNALLHSQLPLIAQGQRFFPLCEKCTRAAKESAKQGCICDCLGQALCFKCKCDLLETAAARRDAEVDHRLGFVPCGEQAENPKSKYLFMKPVLRCICRDKVAEGGDGGEGILRCAGCEGTVNQTAAGA